MNKNYDYSEYDIKYVQKNLKKECIVIRVNYYRFKGFWYECSYIPYNNYFDYSFHTINGLYKEMSNLLNEDILNKDKVVNFINNIKIDRNILIDFFNSEMEKIKILDERSDVKMYDFFKLNYKKKLLFFDCFHPTNIYFYEIFRQLVKQICNYDLPNEDIDFLNNEQIDKIELTHWTTHILPCVKQILDLQFSDIVGCFHPKYHPKRLHMNVYDNYYIRLSPINFEKYLCSEK